MTMTRALCLALLFAAAGAAETAEEPSEVKVALKAVGPQGDERLGYSSPRKMEIETIAPRFLFEVPKFQAKDPLFFRVSMGETKGVPFYGALDRDPAGLYHDRLYLDRNRDLDLTNDGDPVQARVRDLWTVEGKIVEFLDVQLDLAYTLDGSEIREPYACVFYYVLERGEKVPTAILVERDGWREGTLAIGDQTYRLAVIDDDSDGQFSNSDSWVMRPQDTTTAALLSRDATRSMLFPSWSPDQKWTVEVKGIDAAGRGATVTVTPAKETERDYFVRVARQRQTPEERSLNIDPLRPKVDGNDKVDWITDKDVAYALDIAKSPRVQKRVLVEFGARTCEWCQKMEQYTFRDREVVELSKRFVCLRLQPQTTAQLKAMDDAQKRKVAGTPTYLVLDMNGAEVARHQGFSRPSEFAAWLKAAQK